ncbi:unnamed protein product [Clonostachys solani]|uniref:Uncharacterized protein n=1 Tax=Clonostachys solani TaxID=160281 RepID=A0A9N9YXS3_9HYPO|nr:unnamed protein product [Clonostachys solani]
MATLSVSKQTRPSISTLKVSSEHAPSAAVRINDQRQTFEFAHTVYALGADLGFTVLCEPDVQVAATTFGPVGTEVHISHPLIMVKRAGRPYRASLVSGRDWGQDDLVREDL